MNKEGIAWFEELKRYSAECRRRRPLIDRRDLSLAEEMQCRIIGDSFKSWLERNREKLFQEGVAVGNFESGRRSPFLVFTSNQPGLVSAREILSDGAPNITFLYPVEFEDWKKTHPDDTFEWHVHFCSNFGTLSPRHDRSLLRVQKSEVGDEMHLVAGKSLLDKYPLNSGGSYWVHEQGTMWGTLYGSGEDRLWKWNGTEAVFVRNLGRWVS